MADLLQNLGGLPAKKVNNAFKEVVSNNVKSVGLKDVPGNALPAARTTTTADQGGSKPTPKPTAPTVKKQKVRPSSKFGPLRYPNKEIYGDTDYLQIDVLQYKPLGLDLTKKENNTLRSLKTSKGNYNKKEDILGTIFLPIPQNISSTNSTGWGEDSLNTIAAYGLGAADGIMKDSSFIEGIINAAAACNA